MTAPDLARALDALEVRHALANVARSGESLPLGPGAAIHGGPGLPLNRIYGLGFDPDDVRFLADGEAFLTSRGDPRQVEVTSHADPAFVRALGERGYRLARVMNQFVRPLGDDLPPVPPGPREASPEEWLAALDDDPPHPVMNLLTRRADTTFWVHEAGGAAIANATSSVFGPFAVLFAATTRAAHRGRGAQTALLAARLHAARAAGAGTAVVLALPGSVSARNIERAGFRLALVRLLFEG